MLPSESIFNWNVLHAELQSLEPIPNSAWESYEELAGEPGLLAATLGSDPAASKAQVPDFKNTEYSFTADDFDSALIMRALYGQPVSAPKADGKTELPQSSVSKDSLVSKSATPAVSLKPSDNTKTSSEKTLPSITLQASVPPSSIQPRWESWRNPSSRESEKPSNGGTAPSSDSWRSNTSGSSNATSWRSDSKSAAGSSSLKAQAQFTSQLPGRAGLKWIIVEGTETIDPSDDRISPRSAGT
ncbi:hypothetical protein COOONC_18320 [Cooperia oncophora]